LRRGGHDRDDPETDLLHLLAEILLDLTPEMALRILEEPGADQHRHGAEDVVEIACVGDKTLHELDLRRALRLNPSFLDLNRRGFAGGPDR
jgi:hypothetical protein